MTEPTVASYLVETLAQAGVKRMWGLTGDSLNGITDALYRAGKIDFMHVRHEEVAAFAAGAEAAISGNLAVCAGSCGPGNLHLINGLFDCHRSRVPVLAIASHIPSTEIGLDYFQETHPQDLFRECSHFCELVLSGAQFPHVLERALRAAIGQRGVAVIVVPGDVSYQPVPGGTAIAWSGFTPPIVTPDAAQIDALASLLSASKKTTIFAGAGCEGAHDELIALADRIGAPIVHAYRGKEWVEWDNPFDVGMTGMIGFPSGYQAMKNCDTLLLLGVNFPYRNFYPTGAKVAQVDIRPDAIGRRVAVDLPIVGDVKATLAALLPHLQRREDRGFLNTALDHYQSSRADLDAAADPSVSASLIHPQFVAKTISDLADEDAIFSVDVGTPVVWGARYFKMNGKRRILGSFNHGSMANAMPQALGAKAACPDRQVISLSGDGGLSMLMGDLLSIRQLKLPIKIVVLNNSSLAFVAMEMKADGLIDNATDLDNPDFAALAKSIGIRGLRVEKPGDLAAALRDAFGDPGPVLVDVVTAPTELAVPPKIQLAQAKGMGLYAMKAIMSGRGDKILELIEENWHQA